MEKKSGLTLVELIMVLVTSMLIVLCLVMLFLTEYHFRIFMNNEIAAIRGARYTIDTLSGALRFADTFDNDVPDDRFNRLIKANIRGGYLTDNPCYSQDRTVWYGWNGGDTPADPDTDVNTIKESFDYDPGGNDTWTVVATNIQDFSAARDPSDNGLININLVIKVGDRKVALYTMVRLLPR
jgi:hypothetical protein